MLRLAPYAYRSAALRLLLPLACACSELDNCPNGKPDITIETGVTIKDARTYASAPLGGPRDAFPAKTTLHFAHRLGFTPETVESFVSFVPEGPWSENAGNQGEWRCVDDEELVLHNGTCEDFHVVVTASGSGTQHAPCKCSERREDGTCPDQ